MCKEGKKDIRESLPELEGLPGMYEYPTIVEQFLSRSVVCKGAAPAGDQTVGVVTDTTPEIVPVTGVPVTCTKLTVDSSSGAKPIVVLKKGWPTVPQ